MGELINPAGIRFHEPERQEIGENRYYYIQLLTYNNENLYIQTDWFESQGLRYISPFKSEMLVAMNLLTKNALAAIQAEAIKQLKFPPEYQITEDKKAESFKTLPLTGGMIFAKCTQATQVFDGKCNMIAKESCKYGKYRVILQPTAIYIGSHGTSKKLASLQLKISQIQYCPVETPCMFEPVTHPSQQSEVVYNNKPVGPERVSVQKAVEEIEAAAVEMAPKKKPRRPKLQRQNAMIDMDIFDLDKLNPSFV
jgi:hypothetical protein